jgi:hypothetical protein
MKKLIVGVGERFEKLTVINMLGINENGFSTALCRCDCGRETTVKVAELRSGHRRTCGCGSWKAKSNARDENLSGKTFGRLKVIRLAGKDNRRYRLADCECKCGIKVKIRIAQMLDGSVQSCGCLQKEKAMENLAVATKAHTTHGMSGTLTTNSWSCAIQRCYNPRSESFYRYGSRGITMCSLLKASPLNLELLIGKRPSAAMSLDRIDNSKGYFCGHCEECLKNEWPMNVRWATQIEQSLNTSGKKRFIEIDGVTKRASEWCRIMGLPKASKLMYTYPKANDEI